MSHYEMNVILDELHKNGILIDIATLKYYLETIKKIMNLFILLLFILMI